MAPPLLERPVSFYPRTFYARLEQYENKKLDYKLVISLIALLCMLVAGAHGALLHVYFITLRFPAMFHSNALPPPPVHHPKLGRSMPPPTHPPT